MDWLLGFDRAAPGLTLAFVAGAVNTLSPCCLAMTPAFLAHLAGVEAQSAARRVRLTHALVYVVGFSLVFVAIGAGLSFAGYALTDFRSQLFKVGGTMVIAFGLVQMGVFRVPALQRSFELRLGENAAPGYARSFLVGATYSVAWTPCIGPVLGAILTSVVVF
ncbi:MAG: cytochrome c biogenesis protein CcdA, partial [Gammaproteobacteria bacterium]|nr:cytochrome c biogenesis protein CcdA [Gammaproteobacteria bacterium]